MKINQILFLLVLIGGGIYAEIPRYPFFPNLSLLYTEPQLLNIFYVDTIKVMRIEDDRGRWLEFDELNKINSYGYYSDGEKIEYIFRYKEDLLNSIVESYLPYEYYELLLHYKDNGSIVELYDKNTSELISIESLKYGGDTSIEIYKSFTGFETAWKKYIFNNNDRLVKIVEYPNTNDQVIIEYFYENDSCNKVTRTTVNNEVQYTSLTEFYYSDGVISGSLSKELIADGEWIIQRKSSYSNYVLDVYGNWLSYEYLINEYDKNGDIKDIYKGNQKRKIDYYE